jgi:hypothetical protein
VDRLLCAPPPARAPAGPRLHLPHAKPRRRGRAPLRDVAPRRKFVDEVRRAQGRGEPPRRAPPGDDVAVQAFWERLRAEAPTRKLGKVDARVACSLLAPDASLEGESAAAVELQATGWVAWVDRCLPGEGSLLNPQHLPFDEEALPPLRLWLHISGRCCSSAQLWAPLAFLV